MFGLTTIAMNNVQYAGSLACGQCVRVYATGKRCANGIDPQDGSCGLGADPISGQFDAVVTDELVERGWGDIDLGRQGDGHWPVSWQMIECPTQNHEPAIWLHEGSNPYFVKVLFMYLDSPWVSMELNGMPSSKRWHDNHAEFTISGPDASAGIPFDNGVWHFTATSVMGTKYCGSVDSALRVRPYEYKAWKC
jgi:hypothetical protein